MKNEMTKLLNYFKKVQQVASDQVFPGYPFRDSVILYKDNKGEIRALQEYRKSTTFSKFLHELKASCFDYILGVKGGQKQTWLYEAKIPSCQELTSYDFDRDNLYIDSDLVARYYLAICSAYNEIVNKKLDNFVVFAEVDLNEDFVYCEFFNKLEEAKKKFDEWVSSFEEE